VAAEASPSTQSTPATRDEQRAWIATLPASERDDLLVRVMEGEKAQVGSELGARFTGSAPGRTRSPKDFARRLAALREAHAGKRAFPARLLDAGL